MKRSSRERRDGAVGHGGTTRWTDSIGCRIVGRVDGGRMQSSMQHSSLGRSTLIVLSCLAVLCAGCSSPPPSSAPEDSTSIATSSTSTVADQATSTTEASNPVQASSSTVAAATVFEPLTITGTGDQHIQFSIPGDVIATLTDRVRRRWLVRCTRLLHRIRGR